MKEVNLIIAPYYLYASILKKRDEGVFNSNVKIFTKEQLVSSLFGRVKNKALYYLIENEGLGLDLYLKYLPFLVTPDITHEIKENSKSLKKLDYLQRKLKENKLISLDNNFLNKYKERKCLVIGYRNDDKYLNRLLKSFTNNISFYPFNKEKRSLNVYSYPNVISEVAAFFNEVSNLIKKGVKKEDIKLLRPREDYLESLRYLSIHFNINIIDNVGTPLLHYPLVKEKFNNLFLTEELFNDRLATFLKEEQSSNELNEFKNLLIFTPKLNLGFNNYKYLISHLLEKKNLLEMQFEDGIEIVDSVDIFKDNEHLFILDFSQSNYPHFKKEIDLVTKEEKVLLGLPTNEDEYLNEKDKLIKIILNKKHLYLSFATQVGERKYEKSILVDELGLNLIKGELAKQLNSTEYARYIYGISRDLYRNFSEDDGTIKALEFIDPKNEYLSFDNSFKGINYINTNSIVLSYTSVDRFYNCPFSYYLERVLKIGEEVDTHYMKIGLLAHKLLEESKNPSFDFKTRFVELLKEMQLSNRDRIIMEGYEGLLRSTIKFHLILKEKMSLIEEHEELPLEINIDAKTKLKGIVDKLYVVGEKNNRNLILIDYKTGNSTYKDKFIDYGLNLQLPIYCLLISNNLKFSNDKILGIYIQKIRDNENYIFESEKEEENYYYSILKFIGKTLNDSNRLRYFDPDYELGGFIDGLVTSTGNFTKAKSASEDYFIEKKSQALEKVEEANKRIRNSEFIIQPIIESNSLDACLYCEFKDVCFRRSKDFLDLNKLEASTKGEGK
ncbi:MAG TPA: PD-(D/E)XK nuclease family protein [Bacilli bacterium]|nr:PD-(D/E)XK nuclease family protein [Bacilli bacterium]